MKQKKDYNFYAKENYLKKHCTTLDGSIPTGGYICSSPHDFGGWLKVDSNWVFMVYSSN
jgi:hypothetical protein